MTGIPDDVVEAVLKQVQALFWMKDINHNLIAADKDIVRHTIAAYRKAMREREWQPIETAPMDGHRILLCQAYNVVWIAVGAYVHGKWMSDDDQEYAIRPPTHWMHLPETPAMLAAVEGDGE